MDAINFEQARQHALDRLKRELPPGLFYHGLEHTRDDVAPAVERLAEREGIQGESLYLLLTAAWFHDLGFTEQRIDHELIAIRMAFEVLPGFGYTTPQIKIIQGIIMATLLPQSPGTLLEKIMADADLDVLGRDDFMFRNENLRREIAFYDTQFTDLDWYTTQLRFLEAHTYFTGSARTLRAAGQLKNIADLRRKVEELGSGK